MTDINELRQLAQAATPGGWYVESGALIYGCKDVTDGEEEWRPVIACIDDDEPVNYEGNAAFIAAANPAVMIELLNRLEAAEKECDALRTELAQLHKEADKFDDDIDWIQRALQAEATIEAMERELRLIEETDPIDASIILAHYNAIPTLIEEVKLRGGSFSAWDRARTLTQKYQGWELVMKWDIEARAAIAKATGE